MPENVSNFLWGFGITYVVCALCLKYSPKRFWNLVLVVPIWISMVVMGTFYTLGSFGVYAISYPNRYWPDFWLGIPVLVLGMIMLWVWNKKYPFNK